MLTKFVTIAAVALVVGVGSAGAASYGGGSSNGSAGTDRTVSGMFGYSGKGANLSIFEGSSFNNSTFARGRCTQAINANQASDVRAWCPPQMWLPDQ